MLREFYKDINFDPSRDIRTVYKVTQGDTKSRGLIVTLILGDIVTPAGLHTMKFFAVKPDKTTVLANATIDGDKFIVDFTNQVLAVPGVVVYSLVLYGTDGDKIADKKFKLIVESSLEDGAVISVNERGILDRAFELAEDIVPRLELLDLIALEGIATEYATLKPELMQAKTDVITATGQAIAAISQANTAVSGFLSNGQTALNTAVTQAGESVSAFVSAGQSVLTAKIGEVNSKLTEADDRIAELEGIDEAEILRVNADTARTSAFTEKITEVNTKLTEVDSAETARTSAENARVLAEIAREQNKTLKKYGVKRIFGATSPILERMYDAVGKVANVPLDDSAVVDDFDSSIYPWNATKECKILPTGRIVYKGEPGYAEAVGDWMTEIPYFYASVQNDGTSVIRAVSQYPQTGFYLPNIFINENGSTCPKIYVGRFKTSKVSGVDVSRPDLIPENLRDLASFRTGAKAKGAGWQLIDVWYKEVLDLLYTIKYAHLNSQLILGNGLTSFRYNASDVAVAAETGVSRVIVATATASNFSVGDVVGIGTSLGANNIADKRVVSGITPIDGSTTAIYFDGSVFNVAVGNIINCTVQKTGQTKNLNRLSGNLSGTSGRKSNKFIGIEDIFGNCYEWVDGLLINERIGQVCKKSSLYASTLTADYKALGYTNHSADGYWLESGYDTNYPGVNLPISIGGGSTTGHCDYYYQNTGLRGASFGGYAYNTSTAGLFSWLLIHTPSGTAWYIGSRLLWKP